MSRTYLKNKRGLVLDVKSILIPVTIAGFILGTMLNETFKEKDVEANAPSEKEEVPKEEIRREEVRSVTKTRSASVSDTQNSLMRLKDYMNSMGEKNAFLQQNNELLKSLLDARDKELAAFQAKEQDLKKDMGDLQAQLATKNAEISALSGSKLDLENQAKELKSQADVFFTSHTALGNQLNKMQEERATLISQIDKLKDVNENLEVAMTSLTESVKKQEQEKSELMPQLELLKIDKQNAAAKLEELQVVKVDNERRIAELERRLDEMQREYNQARNSVSQTTDLYSRTNAALQDKQDEVDSLQNELLEVMAERNKLSIALTEKDAQLIELNSRLKLQEKRNLGLVSSIEKREQSMEDLRKGMADRTLHWQELELERDEARRRIVQLEQELLEQISFNESLKEMVRDLTSDLDLLRAEKESRN